MLTIAAVFTMGDVQQAHAHLTQNAGQPLSGRDSLSPIVHVSGISSEPMPLASAMSNANSTPNKARRILTNLTLPREMATLELLARRQGRSLRRGLVRLE